MFQITVKQGLFGPKVSGLGSIEHYDGHANIGMTVKGKYIRFFLKMDSSGLLRSIKRGGRVVHRENGMRYTFSPVYCNAYA